MRILHLSDIHYRIHYPIVQTGYGKIFQNMTSPLDLLAFCRAHLQEEAKDIDAVLISGDLTEDGSAEDYRELKRTLEEYFPETPIIAALGNHDCKAAFYEGWLNQNCTEAYRHVVKLPELQVIVLDNAEPEIYPNGRITEEDCSWLESRLEEAEKQPVLLMMHHQILNSDVVQPCSYPPRFEKIVEKENIIGICCGHTHHYCKGMIANKPYYIASGMSFIGLSNGKDRTVLFQERYGYNYYVIENGQIQAEEMVCFQTGKELGKVIF